MVCPKCGSENVLIQQVQTGSTSKTKTKHYETHHGIMWWLLVGWWWVPVKWFGRVILFCCTAGLSIFIRRKHEVGRSKGTTTTKMKNKTMATCQNCGKTWNV